MTHLWMSRRFQALTLLGAAIVAVAGCRAPRIPPVIVQPVRAEYEPFRAVVQKYVDDTAALRREAAARGQAVPNQTNPDQAALALRVRVEALAEAIRTRIRPTPQPGAFFSPPVAELIRGDIARAFQSPMVDLIRDELQEQNEGQKPNPAEPVLNQPVTAPRLPPLLLSALPSLPESLEFDFLNDTVLLRDAEANLLLDVLPRALPEQAPQGIEADSTTEPSSGARTGVLALPDIGGATIFAAIGDSGTGDRAQHAVADAMVRYFTSSRRFGFVIMLGDNLYGDDYVGEFSVPYKGLLDRGISFFAAIGNHDSELQRQYKPFNMNDRTYYAFTRGQGRFVVLNSNQPADPQQLEWLDTAFGDTGNKWRIAFFHHPLYSSGQHAEQSRDVIRPALEAALVRNKVDVVFGGHEHLYERIAPQQGIRYFVSGGGGRRLYTVQKSAFDEVAVSDHHFMVIALAGDRLFFEAITPLGRILDCGVLWRTSEAEAKGPDATTSAWLEACRVASARGVPTNQNQ